MVYVEGPDDIPFWSYIFSNYGVSHMCYEIVDIQGKENSSSYIDDIKNKKVTNIIVINDLDYNCYDNKKLIKHPLIMTTYGYSIENSMYCPYSIANLIAKLSRSSNNFLPIVNRWYEQFCQQAKKLLPYDVANYINRTNTSCFGHNCCQYLKSNNSPYLDEAKITEKINELKNKISTINLSKIRKKIRKDKRETRFKIKGHFITNGIINMIKSEVNNCRNSRITPINREYIYSSFVQCNNQCGRPLLCKDKNFLYNEIENALKYLEIENIKRVNKCPPKFSLFLYIKKCFKKLFERQIRA